MKKLTLLFTAILMSSPIFAQGIEEIIVTANKREQTVQDILDRWRVQRFGSDHLFHRPRLVGPPGERFRILGWSNFRGRWTFVDDVFGFRRSAG